MIEPMKPNVHASLCYVLWHHQGASSPIGQQIRPLLGLGQHDRLTDEQLQAAKRVQQSLMNLTVSA
jgi:hypothetical protein